MDRRGIGQDQFIQLRDLIGDQAAVKVRHEGSLLLIHRFDHTDIAVKHFLIVIVPDLHDLVLRFEQVSAPPEPHVSRINGFLERLIQIDSPHGAALHRGQDLDLPGRRPVIPGQPVFYQIHDLPCSFPGKRRGIPLRNAGFPGFFLHINKEKIALPSV